MRAVVLSHITAWQSMKGAYEYGYRVIRNTRYNIGTQGREMDNIRSMYYNRRTGKEMALPK